MSDEVLEQQVDGAPEGDDRVRELEAALAEREARLGTLQEQVDQWRQAQERWEAQLAALEQTAATLRAQRDQMAQEAERARTQVRQAVERLRGYLLAPEPEVPEELVQGETVEELEAAYQRARALVERVRQGLRAAAARGRAPAGAPVRSGPSTASLSPREKVLLGLRR